MCSAITEQLWYVQNKTNLSKFSIDRLSSYDSSHGRKLKHHHSIIISCYEIDLWLCILRVGMETSAGTRPNIYH